MGQATDDDPPHHKGSPMAKDERTQPIAGTDAPDAPRADDAEDTEGHSMGLLLGMNAVSQARDSDARSRSRNVPEEELTPLSKKWPSMRAHKKA
jgi:hypothetical protein